MRVRAREEEELIDEDGEPVGVSLDDPEVALARRGEGALGRVERHLEVAAERGERSPQLVRRGRDELVLEPVELEEALVLGRQLGGGARERVGLLLQESVTPARLLAEALDHQAGDGGDGREDERAAPAGAPDRPGRR